MSRGALSKNRGIWGVRLLQPRHTYLDDVESRPAHIVAEHLQVSQLANLSRKDTRGKAYT